MAMTFRQQCTAELSGLMRSVVERIDIAKRGEPVPHFDNEQLTALLCCVGDAVIANHRALRPA